MARDILFVLISDSNVPGELVRLLEREGFRLSQGPDGWHVCRSAPDHEAGPQVALIVTQPEEKDPESPFRAVYARVRRLDLEGPESGDAEAVERLLKKVLPPDAAA